MHGEHESGLDNSRVRVTIRIRVRVRVRASMRLGSTIQGQSESLISTLNTGFIAGQHPIFLIM